MSQARWHLLMLRYAPATLAVDAQSDLAVLHYVQDDRNHYR